MPEVTGLELVESARAEDPAIPILLMSGSAPEQITILVQRPVGEGPGATLDSAEKGLGRGAARTRMIRAHIFYANAREARSHLRPR
jgi:hypothetical protein